MAKPRIIIADTDINYVMPLQLKFAEEYNDQVDVEIITDPKYFTSLFSQPQKADILIVSVQLYDNSLQRHNISSIFLMAEQPEESTEKLNITRIFKYSSLKEIFNEIVGKSGIAPSINKKKATQVVYVCSAYGGIEKTALALAVCSCLAKSYKRVLYINAGYLQSFQRMMKDGCAITSSDVYAKLIAGKGDLYSDIKYAVRKEEFFYLPPFKAALISLGIKFSVYEKIISSAKKSGEYDYIVVNSDTAFDENNVQLLNLSDKVIVVTEQTQASVFATNVMISNINGAASEKYLFVCNNFDAEKENALVSTGIQPRFTVSEYIGHIRDFDKLSFNELANDSGIQRVAFLIL